MASKPTYEELERIIKKLEEESAKRRQAEEALRESEKKYRLLFENSGAAVFYYDTDGKLLLLNRRGARNFGGTKKDLTGKSLHEIFPETADLHLERIGQIMERGRGATFEDLLDLPIGKTWVSSNVYPVRDEDGNVKGVQIISYDITERKQAEDELRQSERRFREMADLLPTIVCEMETDNRLTYTNRMGFETFGYSQADLDAGLFITDLIHPDDLDIALGRIEQISKERKHGPEEYRFLRKDGSEIIGLTDYAPIHRNDELIGIRFSITDTTEKKKLESQLHHAQKMEAIGTLAGGIAHNFNNLLMTIMGNVSLMSLETHPDHANCKYLKNIKQAAQSGARLTGQLLGYARGGKYEVKPLNLNKLVKEACEVFSMTHKDIIVHQDLSEDLAETKADRSQIEQVLLNLHINAAEAMSEGGEIFIKTANISHRDMGSRSFTPRPGEYVLLMVRDTGAGMDKKTMSCIFEPFFSTKGLAKSAGLGLASAYGIIKNHDGYIDVESQKGEGTAFYVYLPVSKKKAGEAVESVENTLHKGSGTILLVDDEDLVLDVGTELLESLGYTILKARDGAEAIDIFKEGNGSIDMVFLDIVMPGMSGKDTYDRLKELNPDVKVLLSSGYDIDTQATEILNRGADGFIQKPFALKDLSQKIKKIMEAEKEVLASASNA
ncbi:MAG: PAS domain S-box protein [Deltaproteobacteria bacterium]|nr:PAS domain S-box protein [Deltaproteobacteria bacterium]